MKIDRILAGIRESQNAQKTASEKPAEATSTAPSEKAAANRPALATALSEALASATEKTAAVVPVAKVSPVTDVMKVAQEIAGSEKEAAIKEAQLLGTAFADAAVARLGEWQKTAGQMLAATPAAPASPVQTDFNKFSQTNPELVKQAQQLGYDKAKADLEKQAEDSYVQGYNDTVDTIHKTASLEFLKAAAVTAQIVQAASK